VWPGELTFVLGHMARGRMIAQGWANVRFLSVYSTIEETSANDPPRRYNRSLPQCVISHCARIKLKKKIKIKIKIREKNETT
jgi:hypothetical protein